MIRTIAGEYALHLFHWLWQTTLVAGLALATVRLAPRSSARFRAAVLNLAFWKFLLPPMLPSPTGVFSHLAIFGTNGAELLARGRAGPILAAVLAFAALHALGGAFRLAGVVGEWRRLRRSLVGARRAGRLRFAVARPGDSVHVPMAFGFRNPAIVFPAAIATGLAPGRRRILFVHERLHLERGHGLMAMAEEVCAAIGWVQPLFRRVVLERRRVREELCDAEVIARMGIPPADYAACLVEVARICGGRAAPASALGATSSAAALRARIAALGRRVRWSSGEVAAAMLLWSLLLPGIRPWPTGDASASIPSTTEAATR